MTAVIITGTHQMIIATDPAITAVTNTNGLSLLIDGSSADITGATESSGNLSLTILDDLTGISQAFLTVTRDNTITFANEAKVPRTIQYKYIVSAVP